jgi:hypothetical protein
MVSERSKAWTVLVRLDAGIVGSNPTRGMDVYVYVYVYSMFVLVLRWADYSSKGPYRLSWRYSSETGISWMPHFPVRDKKRINIYNIKNWIQFTLNFIIITIIIILDFIYKVWSFEDDLRDEIFIEVQSFGCVDGYNDKF